MNFPSQEHGNRFVVASAMTFILVFVVGLGIAGAADKNQAANPVPGRPGATAPGQSAPAWRNLFDGKTLTGWKITDFAGHGEVEVKESKIILGSGIMTGIT